MAVGDYEWFITLAEPQHVTAAAEQLHVAQPTLTRMLARLEQRLGVALFDRHGRRLSLNTYGRIFYEHSRRAQLELDSARRAIADLADPAVGEIRLAYLSSFGSTVVPQLIARFKESSPRVTFTLEEGAAESIADRVRSGGVDIGVVSPRPVERTLAWRSLFRQRLGVAVPDGHRFARGAAVSMVDLADEPFVTMHPGFGMRRLLDELCAAAQFRPRVAPASAESHDRGQPGRRGAGHQPGPDRRQQLSVRSIRQAAGRRGCLPRCRHDLGFRPTVAALGARLHRGRRGRRARRLVAGRRSRSTPGDDDVAFPLVLSAGGCKS